MIMCIKFLLDVASQKLLKSANGSQSYTKNKNGNFLRIMVYNTRNNHNHHNHVAI